MKRTKKRPEPQRRCIFCSGLPISKEHIWAEWMRPFLTASTGLTHLVRTTSINADTGQILDSTAAKGPLHRQGDHRSRKLRVVCIGCNTGWMSDIQRDVKPILIPFLNGQRPKLTKREQRNICAWAAMFTMVFEMADPSTVAIPQSHRTTFLKNSSKLRELPKDWMVWMGRIENSLLPTFHRAMAIKKIVEIHNGIRIPYDTQVTLLAGGEIFFMVFSTSNHSLFALSKGALNRLAQAYGLRRIWPLCITGDWLAKRPKKTLVAADFGRIMDAATAILTA